MLKYTGNGVFLIGVPAKDLSEEEIAELGLDRKALLKSGLWKEKEEPKKPKGAER